MLPLILVTVATAGGIAGLLLAEKPWEIVALTAAVIVALLISVRRGWDRTTLAAAVNHRPVVAVLAIATIAGLGALLREDNFALLMLATALLYATACIGLTLQFGYAGVVNFAGAAFFGCGAYTATVLATHTPLPHVLVLLAGGAVAALVGLLLALPLLRARGHYAALITIAFGLLFKTFLEVNDVLGGPQGLKVPSFVLFGRDFNEHLVFGEDTEWSFYLQYLGLAAVIFGGAYGFVRRLERSWFGLTLDAVRLDETAASAFGVRAGRWKIAAFAIGNALIGLAGATYAMMIGFIAPTSFTFGDSLILVSIVILAGLGNPAGILPAALLVLVLPEKFQVLQEYRVLLFALVVIALLLLRPQGLLPRRERQWPGGGA